MQLSHFQNGETSLAVEELKQAKLKATEAMSIFEEVFLLQLQILLVQEISNYYI
jgi:hypothetical protein